LEAELIVGYENTRETEALKRYYDEREREREVYGVWRHFQQYFSYSVAVSFIGGGNRSKPPTCLKLLPHFITFYYIENNLGATKWLAFSS
jgi:hypothetical protein